MKIVAPVSSPVEMEMLLHFGADEIYCGVATPEWEDHFGGQWWMNRRSPKGANLVSWEEIREMLAVIGCRDLDDLFTSIPPDCRCDGAIPVPPALTEWQLCDLMRDIAATMTVRPDDCVLVGAGRYHHHIPEIVRSLAGRAEFLTSYTPYQPEMAQGTLQGIFEYQTLTARLLGLDVANASLYDGASALAEGLLMGLRIVKHSRRVAVSNAVHPHYREVVRSYLRPTGYEIIDLPFGADGRTDLSLLQGIDGLAAVALQSPNFFGVIEDLPGAAHPVHAAGALLVAAFTEPLAFGLYRNPGQDGADIACGEGQSLGLPVSFGGAGLSHADRRDAGVPASTADAVDIDGDVASLAEDPFPGAGGDLDHGRTPCRSGPLTGPLADVV